MLGRAGLADRVPADASDCHEASEMASGMLRGERVEGAASSTSFGLRRSQRGIAGHLDRRGEHDLAIAGQRRGGLEEPALALGLGDGDQNLHAMPSSTSGTTRSASTRERKRGSGCPSERSIASAMISPEAFGGT